MRIFARKLVGATLVAGGVLAGALAVPTTANAAPKHTAASSSNVTPAQMHAASDGRMHPMAPADWWW